MYRIVRFHFQHPRKLIKLVRTLEAAQEHCSDPETSSRTCKSREAVQYTALWGQWFDGYEETDHGSN